MIRLPTPIVKTKIETIISSSTELTAPGSADTKTRVGRTQLFRALSKLGVCSRGEAKTRIAASEIMVNGKTVTDPLHWVDLENDHIETADSKALLQADTKPLSPATGVRSSGACYRYFIMHKPAGVVTTRSDELGRKTVYDLLPEDVRKDWVFPVGRLDLDSEGLLLLTDDGAWADRLTAPDFHVSKCYRVKLTGLLSDDERAAFRAGVVIEGRRTLPAEIELVNGSWYLVTLREGRNRQIRRMFHSLGYKVKRLIRVSIGPLEMGRLAPGKVRPLEKKWVELLRGTSLPKISVLPNRSSSGI